MVQKHTDPALFVYVCMGVCTYIQKQVNAHTHPCVHRYRQLQTLKLPLYIQELRLSQCVPTNTRIYFTAKYRKAMHCRNSFVA